MFTFIKAGLGTGGTSFPQKNQVPETVEERPCPDNFSTTEGLGLGPRRPAREGVCGAPARFNSGSPRTPTGGSGTERLLDAQPALAARSLSRSTSPPATPGRADKDTTHVSSKCCSKVASIPLCIASYFITGVRSKILILKYTLYINIYRGVSPGSEGAPPMLSNLHLRTREHS